MNHTYEVCQFVIKLIKYHTVKICLYKDVTSSPLTELNQNRDCTRQYEQIYCDLLF